MSEGGAEEARRDAVAGRGSVGPSEPWAPSEGGAEEARRRGAAGWGSAGPSEPWAPSEGGAEERRGEDRPGWPSRWRTRLFQAPRSLRLRVVVMTLVLSSIVMVLLGVVLQRQILDGLLDNKVSAATAEIDNALATAANQLAGAETNPTKLSNQLVRLAQDIGNPTRTDSSAQGTTAGVFDTVISPLRPGSSAVSPVGPIGDVPAALQQEVAAGWLDKQFTTVNRKNDAGVTVAVPALVVGGPVAIPRANDSFAVYLIFPLTNEQKTLAVVQQTLLLGGAALALALGLIAFLVATAVLRPIRRASAVAVRVAAGDLSERMPVRGAAELTTLASSFNDMAEAIRVQIRQLEEFGRLQRRFTSDVSHELRTPLTTVRMAADTLHAARGEFPPHLARSTELLADELDRFESLLADLLEVSRYDAGMAELQSERVDVRAHIVSCVAAAGPVAASTGARIVTHLPPDPVPAEVDSRRLERIVRNLLNNAVDHAEGGQVEVELAADEDALAIAVTDHGVGLRPGEASLVFNRFWRADPSRQRMTGGTGLGLAISLEDARLHGGWLQAWGSPGHGARFRLTLPRHRGFVLASSPLPLRPPGDPDDSDDETLPGHPSSGRSIALFGAGPGGIGLAPEGPPGAGTSARQADLGAPDARESGGDGEGALGADAAGGQGDGGRPGRSPARSGGG